MTTLYYVEMQGVYSAGIFGIFDTKKKATSAAREAKSQEPDDYHDFFIKGRKVNQRGWHDIDCLKLNEKT